MEEGKGGEGAGKSGEKRWRAGRGVGGREIGEGRGGGRGGSV